MNLSEGETVVTPGIIGAHIGEVDSVYERDGEQYCTVNDKEHINNNVPCDDLIKTDSPIRVRVAYSVDAQSLIERAEEVGMIWSDNMDDFDVQGPGVESGLVFELRPDESRIAVVGGDHDLTYPSDSDQILGWLDFHASEECETCGGDGIARCDNPDHRAYDAGVFGSGPNDRCPLCGHRPDKKIPGEDCEDCGGNGVVSTEDDDQQTWAVEIDQDETAIIVQDLEEIDDWVERARADYPDIDEKSRKELIEIIGRERHDLGTLAFSVAKLYDHISYGVSKPFTKVEHVISEYDEKVMDLETERDELRERIREAKDYVTHTVGPGVNTLVKILDGEGES